MSVDAHRQTRDRLRSRPWQDRPEREEAARPLRRLIAPGRCAVETIVRLRAAHAAYFFNGALLEHTDRRVRAGVECLSALPAIDPGIAVLVRQALGGTKDHLIEDQEAFRSAVRQGLVQFRRARLYPTEPVEFSLRLDEPCRAGGPISGS